MPELPEVETIASRLHAVLPGLVIREVVIHHQKTLRGDTHHILNAMITAVSRRAKVLQIQLNNTHSILIHLKMTGQLIFVGNTGTRVGGGHPTADWVQELPSKHTRVTFALENLAGEQNSLHFNDMRLFGWIKVATPQDVLAEFAQYGPDIHTDSASLTYFSQKLRATSRSIKQVILDGAIVAGVGNIYACDGLSLAKIHPLRPANSLTSEEVAILLESLKAVIMLGIELGGATIKNYRDIDGFAGKYQDHVLTYGRAGMPCKHCGALIEKFTVAGRGTYFCPRCQV